MSSIGRTIKNIEAPRPLKSSRQALHTSGVYEAKSIDELISLTENIAVGVAAGQCNQENTNILLSNLRIHGPKLEQISKDTLDRAFVAFRNASQDERLNIMTRLNLLELIELRAKSWQVSDGINTYYKHKAATNVDIDLASTAAEVSATLCTSPTTPDGLLLNDPITPITTPILEPGDLIRTSGKFSKPTKIPGKNYSKDEVVIRNADSGKVMGIKGRRVHVIEQLSETIISFQRVNPGAKERLVQITGPSEEKINYAKQLIEETIRRNASPVALEGAQVGSNSSLASSASDEVITKTNRMSLPVMYPIPATSSGIPYMSPNQGFISQGIPLGSVHQHQQQQSQAKRNPMLLHSYSTSDASLGEYKYTVNVGQHSIKITGDSCDLVRIAKLVLDDYFSSAEFLGSVDAGIALEAPSSMSSTCISSTNPFHPSQFVDSGVDLNLMGGSASGVGLNTTVVDADDEVFIQSDKKGKDSSQTSVNTVPVTPNGLTRSRRSHFSHKDSNTEVKDLSKKPTGSSNDKARIVHEYERLIYYAKSPHSWAFPSNWIEICQKYPAIARNKDLNVETNRFDADKHMETVKSSGMRKLAPVDDSLDSNDPE